MVWWTLIWSPNIQSTYYHMKDTDPKYFPERFFYQMYATKENWPRMWPTKLYITARAPTTAWQNLWWPHKPKYYLILTPHLKTRRGRHFAYWNRTWVSSQKKTSCSLSTCIHNGVKNLSCWKGRMKRNIRWRIITLQEFRTKVCLCTARFSCYC